MSYLSKALSALGYKTELEQQNVIILFHISGALPGIIPENPWDNIISSQFIDDDTFYTTTDSESIPGTFCSAIQALNWLNDIVQDRRSSLRPSNTERQQMSLPEELQPHKDFILDMLNQLGFTSEIVPNTPDVFSLMILGAAEKSVVLRFNAAAQMIKEGKIKPEKIIIVSGARDLWPDNSDHTMMGEPSTLDLVVQRIGTTSDHLSMRETIKSEFDIRFQDVDPKDGNEVIKARNNIAEEISHQYQIVWPTEADMMEELIKKNDILNQLPISVVHAPKIPIKHEQKVILKRPTTQSSLEETIKLYGEELLSKDIAVMSSQPHAKYQQGVIWQVMPPSQYNIHMAASAIPAVLPDAISSELLAAIGLEAFLSSIYALKGQAEAQLTQDMKETEMTCYHGAPSPTANDGSSSCVIQEL